MSRPRLVPSLNYRSKGVVDMSIPNQLCRGFDLIEVYIASNVNDAQSSPLLAFSVPVDTTFMSPSVRLQKRQVEENNIDLTRFIFDLNDYATAFQNNLARIPTDDGVSYVRIRGRLKNSQNFSSLGPIVCVPPFDFFSTSFPTFTFTGNAPDLATNGGIPDVLDIGCMNVHLPLFSQSVNITNLSQVQGGSNLFLSFHAGMTPTILRPGETLTLTGAGAPELFFGSDGGTPLFTARCALVNRG